MKSRRWLSERRASSAVAEGRHKGFSSAIGRALALRDTLAFLRVAKGVLEVELELLFLLHTGH